jgi:hypothetical protein
MEVLDDIQKREREERFMRVVFTWPEYARTMKKVFHDVQ